MIKRELYIIKKNEFNTINIIRYNNKYNYE
jgi:hypothetical protein